MKSLYTYPRLVILLLILIGAAGYNAVQQMPRLEDPHLNARIVTIITPFPGADAARVEALVTEKIENKMRELPEVAEVSSTSRQSISSVKVELKDRITDPVPVVSEIRDKLAEITDLPSDALAPRVDDERVYAFTKIIALKWISDAPVNYAILGRHQEELDTRLRNITGTEYVQTFGLPPEEIAIEVDNDALTALGLSTGDIAQRVFGGDAKNSAGTLSGSRNRFVVEVEGSFNTLERLRRLPIGFDQENGAIKLSDVATISRSRQEPPETLALVDDVRSVVVGARMEKTQRVDRWSGAIDTMLAEFRNTLPEGIEARVIFDQEGYTSERLSGLMENLVYGALVVIVVLLVTLGWRASVISGSILPLAALSALAILHTLEWQIQQMIVTGMIVGLGIMVDNAIVVTDDIQTRLLAGERRSIAVAKTVKKLWLPLLGSTITTVLAFMPILIMPGNAGEFVGGISASVIASLIASYVISFTIIAAIAGRVLQKGKAAEGPAVASQSARVWWKNGIEGKAISRRFKASLEWSVRNPRKSVAFASVLPVAGFILASTLTEQFFPAGDRDQFHIQLELPAQASIEETERAVLIAQEIVHEKPDVVSAHWYMGSSAAKFYYNMLMNRDGVASFAEAQVTASSVDAVDRLIDELQRDLDRALPETRVLVRNLEQGPPYDAPIEIRVVGPDLEVLRDIGEKIQREIQRVPEVTHARTTLQAGRSQVLVTPNEDEVALLGLTLRDVADQLRAAIDGSTGGAVIEATEEVPVRIRTTANERRAIEDIRALEIRPAQPTRDGEAGFVGIPLTAIADVTIEPIVGAIPRKDGERVNTVQGFVRNNVLPETALAKINANLDAAQIAVPPGYRIEFGGESDARNEAIGKLVGQAGILAVLMVIAIVLTFNSFRLGGITFISAIQAAGLGLLSLWVSQYPLGFVVIVGVMGLIGLAINASIVILSELNEDRAARYGDLDAVVRGVMSCGRHIASTTLTTVGGFMPLILSSGDFWPPFAISVAGGAFLSMIVSFYFAPAAFAWMVGRKPLKRTEDEDQTPTHASGTTAAAFPIAAE